MVSFTAQPTAVPYGEANARQAFSALYRQHVDAVYRYALVRVGSHADAQDITAQTFVSALDRFGSVRAESGAAPWLFGIARHKIADHFRGRQPSISLSDDLPFADHAPPPEETVAMRLQIERVAGALRALAPDRAEALGLHLFGGLSNSEVAAVMGKNESAVKMLISRGLADLRTRLSPETREES
ncbi:MAG: sigma-70 family RNA polymerase sigma factor [Anaerolineae bacterium]